MPSCCLALAQVLDLIETANEFISGNEHDSMITKQIVQLVVSVCSTGEPTIALSLIIILEVSLKL